MPINHEERIVALEHAVADLTNKLEKANEEIKRINDADAVMNKRILDALSGEALNNRIANVVRDMQKRNA